MPRSHPRAGAVQGPAGDNRAMLQAAMVTARLAVFVLVGTLIFLAPWPGAGYRSVEIAAFALAGVVLVCWAVAGGVPAVRDRLSPLQPYAFGLVAVTCAAVSALPGGGSLIALSVIMVIAVGSGPSLTVAWIVTGLSVAAVELAGPTLRGSGWKTAAYPAAALLLALLIGLTRRAHRIQAEQSAALAARSEQLRAEQARTATLDERARIAREIHDVLAHALGALGVHIQLAQAVLTDQHDEPRAVELLDQAHQMAADGLAETRRAVHALRGQTPTLPEGLAGLGADHQRRHGAQVTVRITGEPRPLPPEAGLALTRTAQEALVNSAKHAPHQPVDVRLDYTGTTTSLVVTSHLAEDGSDSGQPQFATVNGGYGLTGLRERLLLLDGTLSAGRRGTDWVLEATVPR